MRQDVKDLADAMEAGWQKAPITTYAHFRFEDNRVSGACAMGHALLGVGYVPEGGSLYDANVAEATVRARFPILINQMVSTPDGMWREEETLEHAINLLVLKRWTTPDIIRWLRTFQNEG